MSGDERSSSKDGENFMFNSYLDASYYFSLSLPTPCASPLVGKIIQKSHSLDVEIFSCSSSSQHNSVFSILCHPRVPIWFVYFSSSDKPII